MSIWDQLIADDPVDIDPDLLAAYAEGRLEDTQRNQLREQISRSPRAMELLDGIRSDLLPVGRERPASVPFATAAMPADSAPSSRRTTLSWIAAAAAILLTAGLGFQHSNRQSTQIAELRTQLDDAHTQLDQQAHALVSADQEHAYRLAGRTRPLLHAVRSPALVHLALADEATRGILDESSEASQFRDRQLTRLLADLVSRQADTADPPGPDALLDRAAVHLAANQLTQAEEFITRAEQLQDGDTAESLNLRAAILINRAAQQSGTASEQSYEKARTTLTRALDLSPDFAPAWFNLALLYEDLNDLPAAKDAWRSYIEHEPDPELRDAVRRARGFE